MKPKKLILLLILISITSLIFYLFKYHNLDSYFTLKYLKTKQTFLIDYFEANKRLITFLFFVTYILATAFSIPIASVLTLSAGVIFGLFWGTLISSFASTLGATCAFLISRTLLKDFFQKKFKNKLKKINDGVKKEGSFYLFALRLVPIFPFFLINILMGLTPMSIFRFFCVSQIGMLPGTLAYVNAGTHLAQIDSINSILSPGLIISFAILGLLPLLSKWSLSFIRTQKVFSPFDKPKSFDYNVIIIGAGSGGLVSAYIASILKAKVALIEKNRMGGDCLNTGCVPSKTLIHTAKILSQAKRAKDFGLNSITPDFTFEKVMEHVHDTIKKVAPHDSIERYTQLGIDCFQGKAKVLSPFSVKVNDHIFTTKNIIIATGGHPIEPKIPGIESTNYFTSDTLWNIKKLPEKFLVLGGGPIGCELAQCFSRLGSKVTLVQKNAQILPKEDADVSDFLKKHLIKEGIHILTDHTPLSFDCTHEEKILSCENNGNTIEISFDAMLLATGRKPNTQGFGLEDIGVTFNEEGGLELNSLLATNFPNIFACGDVSGSYQFTHFSAHQAWYASINALFRPFARFHQDNRVIPWCTFTDPQVAHVGINERTAQEDEIDFEKTLYDLADLDRAITDGDDYGFIKVLTQKDSDKILGVTIVSPHAGEIISEFVFAMKHNLGLNKILNTIHIYPTHSEANKYVAGVWKKNHSPHKLLAWIEKFHYRNRH